MSNNNQKSKVDDAPINTQGTNISSKQIMWPYVLVASFLILGISILGMVWASYWRFGFLCFTNSNIWCDNTYTCPGLYQVDLKSSDSPHGLVPQASQPTIINVQRVVEDTSVKNVGPSSGGLKPSIHYSQDLLTKFSANRCTYGLYEFINNKINGPSIINQVDPPILCTCLAQYARTLTDGGLQPTDDNTGQSSNGRYSGGYGVFCTQ